jgi:hypothetical protein
MERQMLLSDNSSCKSCGGRGWKFLTLRRSTANGGGTAERALLNRPRTFCIVCSGIGRAAA